MPNLLADETSPYLLQHQHNPVAWRPWGNEAFAEAAWRDVPIFLSVGYSSCYWCHVMEREVFENESLARQMNEGFVCVKVDREERPDVDEHYMTATQVLAGQGGWPMSAFLTPDGRPFFAGTYFPPTDLHGRPGFGTVMTAMTEAYRDRRDDVVETATQVTQVLERLAAPTPPEKDVTLDAATLARLTIEATAGEDVRNGGFGRSPKFPQETLLLALLHAGGRESTVRRALDAMADGGLRDHLGGGFHRYSTDATWTVPHFEIMLYDQALLAEAYAAASLALDEPRYGEVARACCDFVLREMTDEAGGFYTALDAEAGQKEGGPYPWTPPQVVEVLGEADAAIFNRVYGLDEGFNFADPHGPTQQPEANVLVLADRNVEADPAVAAMRRKLLDARQTRPQPMLDTKVITSWNGLMIRALAVAADLLDEPRYREAAAKAATWLLEHHVARDDEFRLARASRNGRVRFDGVSLEDYAYLGRAMLALSTGDDEWRAAAVELADAMQRDFARDGGGFFTTPRDAEAVLGRRVTAGDNPLPSGNAWAARLLLDLGRVDAARATIATSAGPLVDQPSHAAAMLESAHVFHARQGDLYVPAGDATPPTPADEADAAVTLSAEWHDPHQFEVRLAVADGFHLTDLDLRGEDGTELRHVEVPLGEQRGLVVVPVHLAKPLDAEDAASLSVGYRVCDDTRCLAPIRKAFRVHPPV
jgi:uncharacterized protein YyaL (SSP411 family)